MLIAGLLFALIAGVSVFVISYIDKMSATDPKTPTLLPSIKDASGKFDFKQVAKVVGSIAASGVAVYLLLKLLKIKIFNKVIK